MGRRHRFPARTARASCDITPHDVEPAPLNAARYANRVADQVTRRVAEVLHLTRIEQRPQLFAAGFERNEVEVVAGDVHSGTTVDLNHWSLDAVRVEIGVCVAVAREL